MNLPPIEKCPYCDSEEGFYSKDYVVGSATYNYNFDGSEAENGDYYEGLKHKQGKNAYCMSCHVKLFAMSQIE